MPASAWHYISPIMQNVANLHERKPIESVLDIGAGAGKWGFLMRDLLDFYHHGVYYRPDWKTRIEGIEVFRKYENPLHGWVYDAVHWGNVLEAVDKVGTFDIIIAMEVIEHIAKPEGLELLRKLTRKARRGVILSFPPEFDNLGRCVLEQKERHENPHEEHVAVWKEADLEPFGYIVIADQTYLLQPAYSEGAELVARSGIVDKVDGVRVLVSKDSLLEYELARAASAVEITVLKHPWSGTLIVGTPDGATLHREDLFAQASAEATLRVPLPTGSRRIQLRVGPNARSLGAEAWIKRVTAVV